MLTLIFTLFIFPLMCGVVGWTIANILTEPDMILWPLYDLLVNKWKLSDWIVKPLVGCTYCIAGQVALWSYPFLFDYNVIYHVWAIIFSIFSIEIYNKIIA